MQYIDSPLAILYCIAVVNIAIYRCINISIYRFTPITQGLICAVPGFWITEYQLVSHVHTYALTGSEGL